MSQLGLESNTEVANAIAYCTEGNLLATMQEIQKLKIAYPDGKINLQQYLNQIDQQSQYTVFGMIDSALQGDTDKVNKIFRSLKDDSTPPVILISSLYRELKNCESSLNIFPITSRYLSWDNRYYLKIGKSKKTTSKLRKINIAFTKKDEVNSSLKKTLIYQYYQVRLPKEIKMQFLNQKL